MYRPPDYMYRVSEALSEVMDDIGVNERLVMKRRRAYLMRETICTILSRTFQNSNSHRYYYFGSQSEGSTTLGLWSDTDILISPNTTNCTVIQSMSEWKLGVVNYMMIQNENIAPGYCYLQCIRSDLPLCVTVNDMNDDALVKSITDSEGRQLKKNTLIYNPNIENLYMKYKFRKHGPAVTYEDPVFKIRQTDMVNSYYSESLPHQVYSWLQENLGNWPTEDVLEECRNAGCFVVPVGSKVHSSDILESTPIGNNVQSPNILECESVLSKTHSPGKLESNLEWRISTSLQERHLMFSLNIPQLRCYILMKMILATHINPHVKDVLSSFMCKNVLWYCIAYSSQDWHTGNLLAYLHKCLFMLKECVIQRNCPHFILQENNLLAGHMTDLQRGKLLDIINQLMKNEEQLIYQIKIDDLGKRLKMELNQLRYYPNILSSTHIFLRISDMSMRAVSGSMWGFLANALGQLKYKSLALAHQYLFLIVFILLKFKISTVSELFPNVDIDLLHTACDLLIPMVSSTLGSVKASLDIHNQKPVSDEAFNYLEAGKKFDALSGRLKLVSVLYCTEDMERVEQELKILQTQYNISEVHTTCNCYNMIVTDINLGHISTFEHYNEEVIKSNIALCTVFPQSEINCVPHELRYEILRSYIEEDRPLLCSEWMDFIVIDSIPYLLFLQFKTYKYLDRLIEKQQALKELLSIIKFEPNLGHKETVLNLVGQLLEQENLQAQALQCYIDSLIHRKRNNAASFLLCIQLFKLWKGNNTQ